MNQLLKKAGLRILILAAILFYGVPLLIIFAGQVFPMPLHQNKEQIISIELLNTDQAEYRTLRKLEGEEITAFLEQFSSLKAGRYVNDPPTKLGPLTVKINYSDGAVDYIGTDLNQYFDASGQEKSKGWYYAGREELSELFKSYVGPQLLPDKYK